jgi:hypothetical protein
MQYKYKIYMILKNLERKKSILCIYHFAYFSPILSSSFYSSEYLFAKISKFFYDFLLAIYGNLLLICLSISDFYNYDPHFLTSKISSTKNLPKSIRFLLAALEI